MDLHKSAGSEHLKDSKYELKITQAEFDLAIKYYLEQSEKNGKIFNKSTEISIKARKAGNDMYKKTRHNSRIHKEILTNYSKSIAFAPKGTEELVLGYSNRSVILMHLHRYNEALLDIETALKLTKSNDLKEKVQARKKKCLELIEEENLARLGKNLDLCNNGSQGNSSPKLTNTKSAVLPCASASVGLAYNETFGRHLVATRDIKPAEILIVEDGQVCCPIPLFIYCSHCFRMAWNGIPCDDCYMSMYSSETCKNDALNEYHDIECCMLKYMQATVFQLEKDGWERLLSIRLLVKAVKNEGFENVMKEIIQAGTGENLVNILSDGVLQSNKFRTCYNLTPRPEQHEESQRVYEFNTLLILYVLIEHTNFLSIGKPPGCKITIEPYSLMKLKEALLKLRYITNATTYAYETNSWYCGCNNSYGECQKACQLVRGGIMVPCCSLINHSCTSNVGHSLYSNRSALLMHLHHYQETLVDIERALLITNSDGLKKKLQARKEKCLGLLEKEKLTGTAKNLNSCGYENLENLASRLMNFEPSITLPCASESVGLAYNEEFGSHLVATRDIDPGEILIVEQGTVCYPMLNELYLVCSHCLQSAINGIPCDECVFTIYCSETCKNEAFNEYHEIECPMVKYLDITILNNKTFGIQGIVTVRFLLKAIKNEGLESIMKEISGRGNKGKLDKLLSDGILKSDKFRSFYHLLIHAENQKDMNVEFNTLVMLYLLIVYTKFSTICDLEVNPFYNSREGSDFRSDLLLKLKEVLAKLTYILHGNGFIFQTNLWQCHCKNHDQCMEKGISHFYKGIVIVPTCCIINHSCTPNVCQISAPKRKIIIFSTCPIKKGEQLLDNFTGSSLINCDSKTRDINMKRFHLTCKCEACSKQMNDSMIPTFPNFKYLELSSEFQRSFPEAVRNPFFFKTLQEWEMSEREYKDVIEMAQFYYKNFQYCKAYVHSGRCKVYIKRMMSILYGEKNSIPNDC